MSAPTHEPDAVETAQPGAKPSIVRQIGSSVSVAGYSRLVGFAFPIILTVLGFLASSAIDSAVQKMSDLSQSVVSINTFLAGAQQRAIARDQRLDKLEISDVKEFTTLNDHEHRLTVLEQAALAEHERRIELLEAGKTKR